MADIIRRVVGGEFVCRNTLAGSDELGIYKYGSTQFRLKTKLQLSERVNEDTEALLC